MRIHRAPASRFCKASWDAQNPLFALHWNLRSKVTDGMHLGLDELLLFGNCRVLLQKLLGLNLVLVLKLPDTKSFSGSHLISSSGTSSVKN